MFTAARVVKRTLLRQSRRYILESTSPQVSPHFQLERNDLPPEDERYLKPVHRVRDEFSDSPIVDVPTGHRWAMVLPLDIRDNLVVPIPFIIDTGAPNFMYLGSGCRRVLADLGVLVDTPAGAPYRLMRRGDVRIINPPAWGVPQPHEENQVVGDVRVNLLGLDALGGTLVL